MGVGESLVGFLLGLQPKFVYARAATNFCD